MGALRKRALLFASVLAMLVMIGCRTSLTADSKAERDPKRPIASFLKEKDISFSEAGVHDRVLSVSLLSEGEGRCTLEDVKAIMCIYGAVHEDAIEGEVKDVTIRICDKNGSLIYDASEYGVSAPEDGPEGQNGGTDAQDDKSEQEVLDAVCEIISSYNSSIEKTSRIKSAEAQGKKLVVTLSQDIFDFRALDSVFDRLESLLARGGAYTQCEITMVNTKGECVYYMAEDFPFGSRIAWISPAAESAFLDQVGPRRD